MLELFLIALLGIVFILFGVSTMIRMRKMDQKNIDLERKCNTLEFRLGYLAEKLKIERFPDQPDELGVVRYYVGSQNK